MHPLERRQHRRRWRRDSGLARVGSLTRAAIAAGVVASVVLAAQVANLLPGQASAGTTRARTDPAVEVQPGGSATPAPSATPEPTDSATPEPSATAQARRRHQATTRPSLAPPAEPPQPATTAPSVTSGGS